MDRRSYLMGGVVLVIATTVDISSGPLRAALVMYLFPGINWISALLINTSLNNRIVATKRPAYGTTEFGRVVRE